MGIGELFEFEKTGSVLSENWEDWEGREEIMNDFSNELVEVPIDRLIKKGEMAWTFDIEGEIVHIPFSQGEYSEGDSFVEVRRWLAEREELI